MVLTKLNHEETLFLSKKLEKLNKLHQEAIAKEATAYRTDWQSLDRAIWQAVLEYRHILNTKPRVTGSALKSDETIHYEALKDCCNKLLDEVEKGNTPRRQLAGLKILLSR